MILPRLVENNKSLFVNLAGLLLLAVYAMVGGAIFLHLERDEHSTSKQQRARGLNECISAVLRPQRLDIEPLASAAAVAAAANRSRRQRRRVDNKKQKFIGEELRCACRDDYANVAALETCIRRNNNEDEDAADWTYKHALLYGFGILTTLVSRRLLRSQNLPQNF